MYVTVWATVLRWVIAVGAVFVLPPTIHDGSIFSMAFAQDDDDGGDDDDDDDDDDDVGGNDDDDAPPRARTLDRRVRAALPVSAAPRLERAPDEIVVVDLSADDLQRLIARGYQVIRTQTTTQVASISHRLRIPDRTRLETARDEVRALGTGQTADFNHYYRTDQGEDLSCDGPQCQGFELVGYAPSRLAPGCGAGARIGLIDTGINPDHETFAEGQLTVLSIAPEDLTASDAQHGTAVAAILIGRADSRSPGLVPLASVTAIDSFHKVRGDQRSDVFSLVDAMDRLARDGVDVINMSLSGPENIVLERMVAQLTDLGIVVVAVAGNNGPRAEPVFPGAYAPVLTVTAVDQDGNVYRRAGQGAHVDLAAPGVEVWTAASVRGARGKTGTSFAAPFVTAAAAILMAENKSMTVQQVADALTASARDLGEPGPDAVFGAGLVQLAGVCRETGPKVAPLE